MVGTLILAMDYFLWHYSQGVKDILLLWKNLLWFITSFFSLPILARNLLAPWHALEEKKTKGGIIISDILSRLAINTIMRLVGLLIRSVFLCIGLFFYLVLLLVGPFLLLFWLFLPFILVASFFIGFSLILS